MKIGIVVFPGTWSESDTHYATNDVLGINSEYIWHKDQSLNNTDIIILPGGFSYGDYLRTGAIASFSPIMKKIITFANSGGVVIGICNGFQILCESNLLPGVLMRNNSLSFVCENSYLKVNNDSLFTNQYNQNEIIRIPISHGEGNFQADKKIIDEIEEQNRVIFRYSSKTGETNLDHNPNGSINNIAGITNKQGNVLGLMPHPEKACEQLIGSDDGLGIFKSIMTNSIKK
ncbi:MAG: phosphoribosylformylglycinamidine synthase subunit PurQ [Dehalococcoidales bacterium]|nr:phosphoribosylformylglycinamidine synthase subunit PurQ [Dehalococcoidales bacterium]